MQLAAVCNVYNVRFYFWFLAKRRGFEKNDKISCFDVLKGFMHGNSCICIFHFVTLVHLVAFSQMSHSTSPLKDVLQTCLVDHPIWAVSTKAKPSFGNFSRYFFAEN